MDDEVDHQDRHREHRRRCRPSRRAAVGRPGDGRGAQRGERGGYAERKHESADVIRVRREPVEERPRLERLPVSDERDADDEHRAGKKPEEDKSRILQDARECHTLLRRRGPCRSDPGSRVPLGRGSVSTGPAMQTCGAFLITVPHTPQVCALVRTAATGGPMNSFPQCVANCPGRTELAELRAYDADYPSGASHVVASGSTVGMLPVPRILRARRCPMVEPWLDRPERAALVLFQKFEVTRPGGYLTLNDFLDHADFVGLSSAELAHGIDRLVRRGFLQRLRVPREAFALTEAGAEAL